ncbi:MAG: protein translocase subunit SecD [Eubacterium sp.]|nr:protein translocase subunit SecD [Eubacterium sp.]
MNSKLRGALQILLVLILIGAFAFVAFVGVGKAHKGSAQNIRLGLDLKGGVSVTYQSVKDNPTQQEMDDTVYKMQKRVESYSTEAAVYKEGENRITIDIPGATNSKEILQQLGKAGALYFVMLDKLTAKADAADVASGSAVATTPDEGDAVEFNKDDLLMDGSTIKEAVATTETSTSGKTENVVDITFTGKGGKKFGDITSDHVGERMAIVYDDKLVSAPNIKEAITGGKCQISGGFEDFSEAEHLASTLRIGALPLELENIHDNVVGATLGSTALDTSLWAGLIGFILVILFMIVMYRLPGLAASIALVFYILMVLVVLNVLNVTLTLPGIAGIILSIGMAVDANCIIFTRIREELGKGQTINSAIKNGFKNALSAIIDGNVTTLIAAFVLYLRGSGTVKGFAQTLAIGIILSMVTAIFVTRWLMYAFAGFGAENVKLYGVQKQRKTIDFVGHSKIYIAVFGVLVVLCAGGLIFNASTKDSILNYSLDFVGGTSTSVSVDENTEITDQLKEDVAAVVKDVTGLNGEISSSDDQGVKKITIRTTALSEDQAANVRTELAKKFSTSEDQVESETISASVSDEMKLDAIIATIIAIACMLLYIWIRFRHIATAGAAVFALCHDVLVVFTVYVVCSSFIQVGSTFIAVMLTIVGYSINDTIVVFDRIRENRNKANSRDDLKEIINRSISETLSRSINTSVTTFIMVFMLAILGVASVREFAIPLIVGVVAGTYSSICVASPLWYLFSGRGKATAKKAETYSKQNTKKGVEGGSRNRKRDKGKNS